ncbi:hypothetical protein, partial [Avibacterium avium]|uniref:hypothetical protein n=1 Tax=Avibacterium avium TaxID=751 RepID=UPI003BF7B78A
RAAHEGLYAVWSSPSGEVINPDGTSDGASKDIVLYGMRPRAIALKLCIKAQNTFDDVQFWIKAFGAVTNAGELDAG